MRTPTAVRDSWLGLRFLAINLWCTRQVPRADHPIAAPGSDRLAIRTITADDLDRFVDLHAKLRPGKQFSAWRRWLYARAGSKLAWVVETPAREFVGFNMYYFREGEWLDRVVHEAFIGVVEEFRGRGLANAMRSAAAGHFRGSGLHGISTSIHRDNAPSWHSAQREGFREVGGERTDKPLLIRPLNVHRGRDLS